MPAYQMTVLEPIRAKNSGSESSFVSSTQVYIETATCGKAKMMPAMGSTINASTSIG